MSDSTTNYTAKDWDTVRLAFTTSIMVDTSLSSLAQNLEGPDWPIKGGEETPSAYIDLGYDEMRELLVLKGYPTHANLLISILKDTLAFDDPFGDMVTQTEASAERDNQLLKNMAKLGIAEDFPIELTALDKDTREFCGLENLNTLGEFARFAQTMSQNVIVGGDFRKLLNALSHVDENSLTEVLPFRPGAKGLHLLECLAQAERAGDTPERRQAALARFQDEWQTLQAALNSGADLPRSLMPLKNPAAEARVAAILSPLLKGPVQAQPAKKKGLFGRLFGR
jgi:hypothetical protein